MAIMQRKGAPSTGKPASLDDFFQMAKRRAPGPLDYQCDEIIDGRRLHAGEMLRLCAIIRGDSYCENDNDSAETRCAAAYVAAKLGLADAVPVLRKALDKGVPDPIVEFALVFALNGITLMQTEGTLPEPDTQLMALLRMRESLEASERRFADIVLERAAIRYGTIASW